MIAVPLSFRPQAPAQGRITAGALAAATVAGALLAHSPILGVGLLAALTFIPLAFVNPSLALAGWVVLAFLNGVQGTHGAGSNYALLIVFVAWAGALIGGRADLRSYVRAHPRQAAALAGIVVWPAVTLLWAPHDGEASPRIVQLVLCVAVFTMAVSLLREPHRVRWVMLAFIAGTVLSVLIGAATGGLRPSDAFDSVATARLSGSGQDPNYLAAAIVPAIVLAAGLAARRGQPLMRLALLVSVAILGVGLAATESRGGFLAAMVTCLGALIVFRGRRAQLLGFIVVLAAAAAMWFAVSPGSWQRVSSVSDGGSGRTDIWTVALRMAQAHPVVGVGLAQFPVVSPQYLDRPGSFSRGDLLVGERIVVHNLYLQLWAETGLIGVLLFATIAGGSLAAGWRAGRRFEAAGDSELAALSHAAMLAIAGALTASIFLSNVDDRRTWVLFALGPALLAIARTTTGSPTRHEPNP
ncbi:MAG: O-antigen polymerase [Solirubrobacterales bacterium]|nr:O-antigen polymerase [Solirubrobacterales bacterium]